MRLRYDKNANNIVEKSNFVLREFPIKLNNKTVVELGMGKGEMLLSMAKDCPNKVFIGIEKFNTVIAKVVKNIEKEDIKNIFIINKDIKNIEEFFDGKVNEIWLTFSDPWPKKGHTKRRLTYKDFLKKYEKILNKNGIIKLKTDNDSFFNFTLESLKEYGANLIYCTRDLYNDPKIESNYPTGYEKKWILKGKNINYLEFNFN
ncbi:MAG: tRNA (guanosine(46)-N7)-methyltransferase TrmB [Metamycoplasmataceae bacterium]